VTVFESIFTKKAQLAQRNTSDISMCMKS